MKSLAQLPVADNDCKHPVGKASSKGTVSTLGPARTSTHTHTHTHTHTQRELQTALRPFRPIGAHQCSVLLLMFMHTAHTHAHTHTHTHTHHTTPHNTALNKQPKWWRDREQLTYVQAYIPRLSLEGTSGDRQVYFFTSSSSPVVDRIRLMIFSAASFPQRCTSLAGSPRTTRDHADPRSSSAIIWISSTIPTSSEFIQWLCVTSVLLHSVVAHTATAGECEGQVTTQCTVS